MLSLRSSVARNAASAPLASRVFSRFLSDQNIKQLLDNNISRDKTTGQIAYNAFRETARSNPKVTTNKPNNKAPQSPPEPEDGKQRVGYVLHCKFTSNNTILTLTSRYVRVGKRYAKLSDEDRYMDLVRPLEDVRINLTAGILGFRHTKQGEYEAGFQTAARMFALMSERQYLDHPLEIILSNFGKGREAFLNALNGAEGNSIRPHVTRVTDGTKIRIGGVRPPRARRV